MEKYKFITELIIIRREMATVLNNVADENTVTPFSDLNNVITVHLGILFYLYLGVVGFHSKQNPKLLEKSFELRVIFRQAKPNTLHVLLT